MKRLISSLLALSLLLSCLPMGTRAAGANVEVLYPSNGENTGSLDSIYGDMIANSPTLPNLEPTISGSMGTLEPTVPGELIPAIPLPTVPSGGLAPETDDTTPATLPIPPEIDDVPATDGELEQDEVGNWYFRTFAQLKELCSMTFDTPATAYYEGPEDFILSANLAIPANLTVDFSWMNQTPGTVTIPAGVSLISETHTFNDEECMCGADELMDLSAMLHVTGLAFHALNVEGNLSVKEMMVYDSLNVTGKVYNHGTIEFADGASISGEENIIHSTEDSLLYIEKRADDTASLKAAIELVKSQTTPHKRFNLRLLGDATIDADVTVPAGCDFEIGVAFLKIAPGVTLTLDTYTTIICNTTVEGTLVNNGGILLHECYWNAPRVTIAQGGAYRGNGKIVIHDNNTNESSEMFTNLDLNQFTITASDPANHYWVLEKKASSDELYQDADGNWHFKTFEELKQIANVTTQCGAIYDGTEPLVIEEDLLTKESLAFLNAGQSEVVVPAGVTFTMSSQGITFYANKLRVQGTAYLDNVHIYESMDVSGYLEVHCDAFLHDGATITGRKNISFSIGNLYHEMEIASAGELKTAVDKAMISSDRFNLWLVNHVALPESIVIPENCTLYLGDVTLTIPKKVTFQLAGKMDVSGYVVVEGSLVNNNEIYLNCPNPKTPALVMEKHGTYSGNGNIVINVMQYADRDYTRALSGLDLSGFTVTDNDGTYHLTLRDNGPTKLPAPTDLEWGYDHDADRVWDPDTDSIITITKPLPGSISWKPVEPTRSSARIEIFRQGEEEPVSHHNWFFGDEEIPEWRSIDSFILDDLDSGIYYFTVKSNGEPNRYEDSDTVTSPLWTYERPSKRLDVCTNLSWSWPSVEYTGPRGAGGYHVEFWFKETENAEPQSLGSTWSMWVNEGEIFGPGISDSDIYQCGSGYYYYTVRAISTDITTICNSEWVTSPLYNLTDTVIKVDKDLQEISDNMDQMTDGEIRQAVQDMDTQELKDAMLADSGVAETIDELERKAGNFDKVKVKDVSIPAGQVNVIGAGLNTPANSDEGISLVISKPKKEHEVPKGYDSAVALKFSMDLSNVDNTEKLEVPVLITMPIPKGIDPGKLAIIHYHNDGTSEIISKLNVDKRNHTVTFVLTSFSDFTITQTAPEEEILWGDASGDGKVNAMDATRILRYAAKLIAEDKIDLIAADVNSDGRVNAMDATRILRYAAKLITDLKK